MNFKSVILLSTAIFSLFAVTVSAAADQADTETTTVESNDVLDLLEQLTQSRDQLHQQNIMALLESNPGEHNSSENEPNQSLVPVTTAKILQNRKTENEPNAVFLPRPEVRIPQRNSNRDELEKMVELIGAIRFPSESKKSAKTSGPGKTIPQIEEATVTKPVTDVNSISPSIDLVIQTPLPYKPVTTQTLQRLTVLSENVRQVLTPPPLPTLYLSGNIEQAATFYQLALDRIDAAGNPPQQDREWIMFQIANCLRRDNPDVARKKYEQFIAEYPASQWTPVADVQLKLLEFLIGSSELVAYQRHTMNYELVLKPGSGEHSNE